jgi:hypothetical protein
MGMIDLLIVGTYFHEEVIYKVRVVTKNCPNCAEKILGQVKEQEEKIGSSGYWIAISVLKIEVGK